MPLNSEKRLSKLSTNCYEQRLRHRRNRTKWLHGNGYLPYRDSRNNILNIMKTILEWLEEAKQQGYDWADAAIRNYNPNYAIIKETKTLSAALIKAFSWRKSPEDYPYWNRVYESLKAPLPTAPVTPISLEDMIEDLGKLNSAIGNLEHNETLKEPYRTRVYDAIKASYEEQLAETKAEIAKMLGIEPQNERKLIGWVVRTSGGSIGRYMAPVKTDHGWTAVTTRFITEEEAIALCGRMPEWSDDEPTPIYK